ncbi:MAG: hypothetical protein M0Q15_15110 [Nevskia sp.]|jgi:hypothetical protein|nr:hypothetical protein [Nevskia sp.]
MTSNEKQLEAALKGSLAHLDEAYRLIKKIPLEPIEQNRIYLGEAVGLLIQVQMHLYGKFPYLKE